MPRKEPSKCSSHGPKLGKQFFRLRPLAAPAIFVLVGYTCVRPGTKFDNLSPRSQCHPPPTSFPVPSARQGLHLSGALTRGWHWERGCHPPPGLRDVKKSLDWIELKYLSTGLCSVGCEVYPRIKQFTNFKFKPGTNSNIDNFVVLNCDLPKGYKEFKYVYKALAVSWDDKEIIWL